MSKSNGHVVVVGGTKGLGRVVTNRFLQRGFDVTVLSRNVNTDMPQDARLHHVKADLQQISKPDASLVEAVLEKAGPINYLIFCQRYRGEGCNWAGEIQVSLTATDMLIKSFSDHFVQSGDKAVAVVSSVYANFVGSSQPASYHAAKAGLNQLVKYYSWQLGQKGIRINAAMPLTYLKDESRHFYESRQDIMGLYGKFVPLQRMGDANDSANLIDFLCSDKASFITGQAIYVDGGTSVVWPEELAKSLTGV